MSGRKTIQVDSNDYNRLRQQAARATTLAQANNALNAINTSLTNSVNQANNRINALNNNINNLNAQLNSVKAGASQEVQALRSQLHHTVQESNRQLTQMAERNRQELTSLQNNFETALERTRRDTANAIAANNRRIETVIAHNNQQTNRRIDAVSENISNINSIIASSQGNLNLLLDMAVEFTDTAQMLLDDAQKYPCELLLPGELKPLQQSLAVAIANQKSPLVNAPVARYAAQQAYEAALEFHERVIQAEQEWILRHRAAKESIAQAQARIESSRTVMQECTKLPVNVDCWSEGDLNELSVEAQAMMDALDDPSANLTLQNLVQIQRTGQWLEHETIETVAFALGAIEASQERTCMADDISRCLCETHGMEVVDHGYQGNDYRNAHRTHLRNNVTGLGLVITQRRTQDADGRLGVQLEIEVTNPGNCTPETVHAISASILQELKDSGCPVGTMSVAEGCDDICSGRQELEDFARWRTTTENRFKPQHPPLPGQRKA